MSITYLSLRPLKQLLLFVHSLIFIVGCFILINGVIEVINYRTNEFVYDLDEETEKLAEEEAVVSINFTAIIVDRFPSTGSPSVILIFGILITGVSGLGITAVNRQYVRLLRVHNIALVMALFIKLIFIFATICMYAFTIDYNPIRATTIASAAIAIIELALVVGVCHFAKTLKRRPNHQQLPSDQTEPDSQLANS